MKRKTDEELAAQPWEGETLRQDCDMSWWERLWEDWYDRQHRHNVLKDRALSRLKMKRLEEESQKKWDKTGERLSFWNELGEDPKVVDYLRKQNERR